MPYSLINAHTDTSDRGLSHTFSVPRSGCEWFDRHQKYGGKLFLHS